MNERKFLKNEARKNLKIHYFRNIIVTFITAIILSSGITYTTKNFTDFSLTTNIISKITNDSNLKIPENKIFDYDFNKNIQEKIQKNYKYGVLSYLINETLNNGNIVTTLFNGINKLILGNKISAGVIIIISSLILWVVNWLFFKVIEVGKNRFFLEKRRYYETKMERILFPYKVKKSFHIAFILFNKFIYQVLWSFTVIGGVIKYYEYRMIPYILAENPNIKRKDAFLLSKKLTDGEKLELFKMDLSLIGWNILSIFSFNITSIFYSDAYKNFIFAEYYMKLRNKYSFDLLNDEKLNINVPVYKEYPYIKNKKSLKIDYNKDYDFITYILFFFTFACFGWFWEVFLEFIKLGRFINRGTMYGPWLPVYGWGGVLILLLLKKYRDKPWLLFILAFTLCGIVEYGTSMYLEYIKHLKYWDYSGYFLNINGRICLEGLILFGLGGFGFTYIFAPLLDTVYKKIPKYIKIAMCTILVSCYLVDLSYTHNHPNTGMGITRNFSVKFQLTK